MLFLQDWQTIRRRWVSNKGKFITLKGSKLLIENVRIDNNRFHGGWSG